MPTTRSFLTPPPASDAVEQLYDEDRAQLGFVMNASQVWAHSPGIHDRLFDLIKDTVVLGKLSLRHRGILVTAAASTVRDSYCSLAWGRKLSAEAGPDIAANVLRGGSDGLDPAEVALATWARAVASDANATTVADVQALRDAGFDDEQVFAITTFVALRIAFATVNDALGARPDRELAEVAPPAVRDAVTFGRPVAD